MSDPHLALIWFAIVCFEVGLYVVLDGADLGLGMLSLLPHREEDRSLIMHTVGPIWDANETWLVIAAGTLFGAFPEAYAIILNALYLPIMVMLFGLILRAASFEFHAYSERKERWSRLFGFGSLLAVAGQGAVLGGILSGITVSNHMFGGGPWSWATPLTVLITLGIVMGYAVVGYAYLLKKTAFEFREETFERVLVIAVVTVALLIGATLLLKHENYLFLTRWEHGVARPILLTVAAIMGALGVVLGYLVIAKKGVRALHPLALGILACGMFGLLVGVFPYIIPPALTIYDAAASHATLTFMLWGIGPLLPIVLAYNIYLYRVFGRDLHGARGETYDI
ncbi:MAG TPA: cytochrome d ubiquinol oxidase subunit II [Candidatus Paceibacterota bacterium]|nr:cytochrome d ubiquinol oxidase subunit II [Candidatus Paceibacterota bacterium]